MPVASFIFQTFHFSFSFYHIFTSYFFRDYLNIASYSILLLILRCSIFLEILINICSSLDFKFSSSLFLKLFPLC